jgi:hypothetical protein
MMEVARSKASHDGKFLIPPQAIPIPADPSNDFPIIMNCSNGFVYLILKWDICISLIFCQEKLTFHTLITMDTVIAITEHSASGGINMLLGKEKYFMSVLMNLSSFLILLENI